MTSPLSVTQPGSRNLYGRCAIIRVSQLPPRQPPVPLAPIPVPDKLPEVIIPAGAIGIVGAASPAVGGQGPRLGVTPGLRASFRVEQTLVSVPNTAIISVFNLAPQTRKSVQMRNALFTLEAGYIGDLSQANGEPCLPIIIKGDLRRVQHVRRGPDWETRFEIGDGEFNFRWAQAIVSFIAGTKLSKVLKEIANQFKNYDPNRIDITRFLSMVDSPNSSVTGFFDAFTQGYSYAGNAMRALEVLLPGMQVSIQNGELLALKQGDAAPAVHAPLLSPETGLLDSPEIGITTNYGGPPPLLKVKAFLFPQIVPGTLFQLQSAQYNGPFKAQKVIHTGDTGGQAWWTEIEAAVKSAGQP